MSHEKVAKALVQGAKHYIDVQLTQRLHQIEFRLAAIEVRQRHHEADDVAEARQSARARAADGDDDVYGLRN